MMRLALRNLTSVRARLAITIASVAAGVAFVAGTLVFTDTLRRDFDGVLGDLGRGVDLVVRQTAQTQPGTADSLSVGLSDSVVDSVSAVDGVVAVSSVYQGPTLLVGPDGSPLDGQSVGTSFGGPPTAANWVNDDVLRDQSLRHGGPPSGDNEIVVSADTARAHGLAIGDDVRAVLPEASLDATVVGIFGYSGTSEPLGGPSIAVETAVAREHLGVSSMLRVRLAEDAGTATVRAEVASALDVEGLGTYEVLSGDRASEDLRQTTGAFLLFISVGLLGFAAVALVVASAIIAVTFAATTASRSRQDALLRVVGASRRQVIATVVTEAAAVGAAGSLLGVGVGIGLAPGLHALLSLSGLPLPDSGGASLALMPRTIAVSFTVGIGASLCAALLPAVRVGRASPLQALTESAAPKEGITTNTRRQTIGLTLLGAAVVGVVGGLVADSLRDAPSAPVTLSLTSGVVCVVAAAVLLVPPRIGQAMKGVGTLLGAIRTVPGRLAIQGAGRHRFRSAATVSAMAIGIGLTSVLLILGTSLEASAEADLRREFFADLQIDPSNFDNFPSAAVQAVEAVEAVVDVSPVIFSDAEVDSQPSRVAGVEPSVLLYMSDLSVVSGRLLDLEADTAQQSVAPPIALADHTARRLGLALGDEVQVELSPVNTSYQATTATLVSTYDSNTLALGRSVEVLVLHELLAASTSQAENGAYVFLKDGVMKADARSAVEAALRPFPTAQVLDYEEAAARVGAGVGQVTGVGLGLLALSVLVAVLGITNTLGLSVIERSQEIGLLRAVGMSNKQIRSMIRWESLLIALLGGVLGLSGGLLVGLAIVKSLPTEFGVFAVPPAKLAIVLAVAAGAGLVAGTIPTRRATRLDILTAIDAE